MSIICQVDGTGISSQPDTSKAGDSKPSVTSSSVGTSRNRQVPSRSILGASLASRARGGSAPTPGPRSVTYERVMLRNATGTSLRTVLGGHLLPPSVVGRLSDQKTPNAPREILVGRPAFT